MTKADLDALAGSYTKALKTITALHDTLANQNEMIERLKSQLAQKSRQIENLQNTVAHYQEGKSDDERSIQG